MPLKSLDVETDKRRKFLWRDEIEKGRLFHAEEPAAAVITGTVRLRRSCRGRLRRESCY